MSFNQDDSHNLNRSKDVFGSIGLHTDNKDEMLHWWPIKSHDYGPDAADVLAEALMSATRFDQCMNTWIDVKCDEIPAFVSEAIDHCVGFGLRLVLTHNGASSHLPGAQLPAAMVHKITRASDRRPVWHPVAKTVVESIHYQGRSTANKISSD